MRYAILAVAILVAVLLVPNVVNAAEITGENAGELENIIKAANTTYSISAVDGKITVTNTDANNTLLVVFNPALGVAITGIEGANAAIVNATDYTIVIDIGAVTDVGFYGGEMPGHAIALYVGPGASFNITRIEYDVPEPTTFATGLSAPSPPSGYSVAGSKSGSSAQSWFYSNSKQNMWVAFYEGEPAPATWLYIYSYGGKKGAYLWGKAGAWQTRELLGFTGNVKFQVGVSVPSLSKQWSVVWATKGTASTTTTTTTTALPPPSAEFPSDEAMRYAMLGVGAIALLGLLLALTRR